VAQTESAPVAVAQVAPVASVTPVAQVSPVAQAVPVSEMASTDQSANEIRHGRRIQIKRRNVGFEQKPEGQSNSAEQQSAPAAEERSAPVAAAEVTAPKEEVKTVDTSNLV